MSDRKYWVGFNMVSGIGAARLRALMDYFGSLEEAWRAPLSALHEAGLDRRAAQNLVETRRRLDLDREMAQLERAGVQVLTWEDEDYPRRLRQVYNPPPVLYIRGSLLPQDEWAVAVVGTRRPTAYGREAARTLAGELAQQGVTIISGLALGIDATAHEAALDAGGRTIAVIGSGFRHLYPQQHRKLAARIVRQGAVISEYALDVRPDPLNFPPRNRIISGLAMGVLVVEAGERSGALITARFAAEQGREVFAVPGSIFHRTSAGTNRLIQEGAKAITSVQDILEELDMTMVAEQQEARVTIPKSAIEDQILSCLSIAPLHVDEVVRQTGLDAAEVVSTLALMELKGLVRQVGAMQYRAVHESQAPYTSDLA